MARGKNLTHDTGVLAGMYLQKSTRPLMIASQKCVRNKVANWHYRRRAAEGSRKNPTLPGGMRHKAAKLKARTPSGREELVARELALREVCRRRLMPYVCRFNEQYMPGWVHKDIAQRLEQFLQDVIDKKSPRLMLAMPPRAGKSQLTSIDFPTWVLGKYPWLEVIMASYASALALDFSRYARSRVEDEEYKTLFPSTTLRSDARNLENWRTTKGGGFRPAGVDGPITGRGAHILIIDDPIKDWSEAMSETVRDNVKNWYMSTAYTRLAPGGGVIVIQTRWHDDDLSGWLERIAAQGRDQWEVVKYPAIATHNEKYRREGEALHEERYPLKELERIRRAVTPQVWNALYQQNPVADDGEYFQRKNIVRYSRDELPGELRHYAAWDLAIGLKEHNDYTVGLVGGMCPEGNLWLLNMWRGRWDSMDIVENILDCFEQYKTDITGIERGQIRMAIGPLLEQRILERKLYGCYIEDLMPGRRDKILRARTVQGLVRAGKVRFPADEDWVEVLIGEMLRFPNGLHDDCVDTLAWLGLMIENMSAPVVMQPHERQKPTWRDKLHKFVSGGDGKSPMSA